MEDREGEREGGREEGRGRGRERGRERGERVRERERDAERERVVRLCRAVAPLWLWRCWKGLSTARKKLCRSQTTTRKASLPAH